jgi:NAD(P)-dependent dehydrogenase (short-subunit alcohol dehydrogenase family)
VVFDGSHKGTFRELYEDTFRVNVFGAAELSETLLPLLEKADFPRLINVSSIMGSIDFQLAPNAGFPKEATTVCPSPFTCSVIVSDLQVNYARSTTYRRLRSTLSPHTTLSSSRTRAASSFLSVQATMRPT